jgi:hypothetical protein
MALVGASGGEAGDGPPVRARTSSTVGPEGETGRTDFKTPRCTRLGKELLRGAAQGSNTEGRAPARRPGTLERGCGAAGLHLPGLTLFDHVLLKNFE